MDLFELHGASLLLFQSISGGYYGGKGGGGHAGSTVNCVPERQIPGGFLPSPCVLCGGFGGRQSDRPPTSKGWTKGGGGWG